jgi:hypothetical protein
MTIIICTMAARRAYLAQCLGSLACARDVERHEILLVTGPDEDFDDLVAAFEDRLQLRRAIAGTERLADKRNMGCMEAAHDIVAYLDDDTIVGADYPGALAGAFASGAECAVGAVEPCFEAALPDVLDDAPFHIGGFNRYRGVERRDRPIGANCAFRRTALARHLPFDPRLGRGGTHLPWGDDTLMFARMALRHPIVFVPEAAVGHYIQAERLTLDYVLARAWFVGRTNCFVDHELRGDFWWRAANRPVRWFRHLGTGLRGDLAQRVLLQQLGGYVAQSLFFLTGRVPGPPPGQTV